MEYCEVKMESAPTTGEEENKKFTVEQRQDPEVNIEEKTEAVPLPRSSVFM